jgi:hypothetical protein
MMNRQQIEESARKEMAAVIEELSNWTANDGGLTWAASDVLHVARGLDDIFEMSSVDDLVRELENWESYINDGHCDTGTECNVVGIIIETCGKLLQCMSHGEYIPVEIHDTKENKWYSPTEVREILDFWRPDWRENPLEGVTRIKTFLEVHWN